MLSEATKTSLCDRQLQQSATKSNFGVVGHRTYRVIPGRYDFEPSALTPLPGAEASYELAPALMAGAILFLGWLDDATGSDARPPFPRSPVIGRGRQRSP